MAGAFAQGEAAAHLGPIREMHFQNIGKDDLLVHLSRRLAQEIGSDLAGLTRIDILFAFASCLDALVAHDPFDPVLARLEQNSQLAMAHRVILLLQLLNAHRQRIIHLRFPLQALQHDFEFELWGILFSFPCPISICSFPAYDIVYFSQVRDIYSCTCCLQQYEGTNVG